MQAEPLPTEPPTPDAERRQLTVMFCDLADSTKLSVQLDPEDLRDIIRAYQSTSAEAIEPYDGHIAQHLGDGLMVYFGWPQAHEDDAQRAVHAGLGIVEAIAKLNTRLQQEKGIRLAIRIGIHTGLVVVGKIGKGASQEHLALGETPNVASRIEGIAESATVAISNATYQLVQGYFVCEELGRQTIKGVDEPQQVYRVVKESDAQSRLDVAAIRGLTPLVGRESEVTLLLERWEQVKEGQGQVVLLSGEAGIGKSRLIQVLRDHVAGDAYTLLECRSSSYYQNTALYPLTDLLRRTLQWHRDDTPKETLDKLEQMLQPYHLPLEESVPLFASLLSMPIPEERYSALQLTPQRQRQETLEAIVAMLLEQAERQPVLFILEDLHWTDPTTLEWLTLLIEQAPTAAILTLLNCRPEFESPWGFRSHLTPLALNRFTRPQIKTMVQRVADGKTLPAEVIQHLVEKTDGVPLYVEEMTKAILEAGVLRPTNGHYELTEPLASLAIPTTLQDSLMGRLDRLETAKGIAQLGATIGRQFTYELLQAVSSLDEQVVWRSLVALVEAELLYQRGSLPQATFTFKHALIQDTAYQSLLRSTRQQYHQHIAQVLEEQFPETAEMQPEWLAHHYAEAGLIEQALTHYQQAGERATERSANEEAIGHLRRAIDLVAMLPETAERNQIEMELQMAIGAPLMAVKGYGSTEVEKAYSRAHELTGRVSDASQTAPVFWGLWVVRIMQGEYRESLGLGEQCLEQSRHQQDAVSSVVGRAISGCSLLWLGEFKAALDHLKKNLALPSADLPHAWVAQYGQDLEAMRLGCEAWSLWFLGDASQALELGQQAVAFARQINHAHSLAEALGDLALLHHLRLEADAAREQAAQLIALANQHGFPFWEAWGMVLHGWALTEQGEEQRGIDQMRHGVDIHRTIRSALPRAAFLAMIVCGCTKAGQPEEGYAALAEALEQHEELWWKAELLRLEGELALVSTDPSSEARVDEAEVCFQKALDVARRQQAKSWELRAATSLARLWQSQDRRQDAYDLLAPVYEWFTEGFDTVDLQEAKALLQELS